MKSIIFKSLLLMLVLPGVAMAHPGVEHTHGMPAGFAHPLSGLDHMLAMLAVGLWAVQLGGRATWLVPMTFVLVMLLGGVMGIAGIALAGAYLSFA